KQSLRIRAGERELIGVTDTGGFDLDQDLAGLWSLELDVLDDERLPCFVRHGCASFHAREGTAKVASRLAQSGASGGGRREPAEVIAGKALLERMEASGNWGRH